MDSYDNDLMLLLLMDGDSFFVCIEEDSDEAEEVTGDVWPVMEELMEVLRRTNKPLYNATIRKIQD